ncbi:PAS domain-containing sensor histidine kinase [Dulcicalothrix desertica PCC 7102]|uniref:histidine kinase n=1 Tax=Dulcicalothrix desertica PCC 7102 TaxID=232991 RepID=A0A433VUU9_9CYAN|nr:ATP-binding protein [Dulcicalothrix desertica]RUT09782.1 PAS domain-containing sensor histidine kinase [Dulcicalothrix desertica PCC 7102]TWH50971.1 two-component system phosphate regulon sensor histidine kinase PhoR [Dulcicalothrix desertica PCC 7102]
MVLLSFCLGLVVGLSIWVWQQFQLNRYISQVLRPLTAQSSKVALPLIPRLRHELALVKYQGLQLQQQLQTYQDLLEFAPIGYLQLDDQNQLLWCNEQAREILYLQRWQPGQVRLLVELVRSYELDRLVERTRERQQLQIKEWEYHPSCDNAAAMLDVKSLVLRATGLPLPKGQVGVFLENRQPLLEVNQVRDRAFSDLAHELRTPLTSIRLVVETLQDRLDSPLKRWVDRLMLEVDRLINLVQSWLDLTQLETNPTMQLARQTVDLRSLIISVWETLELSAQQREMHFMYSGPDHVWVSADSSRMFQVFINLLDNCIKYNPPGAKIHVDVKIDPRKEQVEGNTSNYLPSVEINIVDSGFGFSEEDLPHVFERFYRGDTARTRATASEESITTIGTGLGLAIVRQIVIAHNGSIKAMNHPETGGAWMQIVLPGIMAKF